GSNSGGESNSVGEGATPPATRGTFMHQSRLPKLQVPHLGDTLGRYLGAVAPLLSPEAFAVTKGVVQEVRLPWYDATARVMLDQFAVVVQVFRSADVACS
ncbi:unnamed protein product, partial [Ectocarpus sp. 8 AP-2014]